MLCSRGWRRAVASSPVRSWTASGRCWRSAALQIAGDGYVLKLGRITHHAGSEALMQHSDVSSAYLGMLTKKA